MEAIFDALTFLGEEVALFIVAMLPLIELRGSVILGAAMNMHWLTVFVVSVIGNMLPIPFLLLFGRKILDWLKTVPFLSKFATAYEEKLIRKADEIRTAILWGLFLFVAIPLPGTGAWSGVLVSTFLGVPPKKALPIIFLGVLTAGVIMTVGSYGLFGLARLF